MPGGVLYFRYSKGREILQMTTFTLIILIMFIGALSFQFVATIEKECFGLACLFAFEIMAFAYLAKVLM